MVPSAGHGPTCTSSEVATLPAPLRDYSCPPHFPLPTYNAAQGSHTLRRHPSQLGHSPPLALAVPLPSMCGGLGCSEASSNDSPACQGSGVSWLLTRAGGLVQVSMGHRALLLGPPTRYSTPSSLRLLPFPQPSRRNSLELGSRGLDCPWEDRTTGTKLQATGAPASLLQAPPTWFPGGVHPWVHLVPCLLYNHL